MAVVRTRGKSHTEDTVFLFSHQAQLPLPVPWSFFIVRVPLSLSQEAPKEGHLMLAGMMTGHEGQSQD